MLSLESEGNQQYRFLSLLNDIDGHNTYMYIYVLVNSVSFPRGLNPPWTVSVGFFLSVFVFFCLNPVQLGFVCHLIDVAFITSYLSVINQTLSVLIFAFLCLYLSLSLFWSLSLSFLAHTRHKWRYCDFSDAVVIKVSIEIILKLGGRCCEYQKEMESLYIESDLTSNKFRSPFDGSSPLGGHRVINSLSLPILRMPPQVCALCYG